MIAQIHIKDKIQSYSAVKRRAIYLATLYTGREEWSMNYNCSLMYKFKKAGFIPFSPICHTHPFKEKVKQFMKLTESQVNTEMGWFQWDLDLLKKMPDVVIMMSRHAIQTIQGDSIDFQIVFESRGCFKEFLYAQENNIPVFFAEDFLDGNIVQLN